MTIWNKQMIREVILEMDKKTCLNSKNIPIEISNRMYTTQGVCIYEYERLYGNLVKIDTSSIKFKFAATLLDGRYNEQTVIDVIQHEYIHYYCAVKCPNKLTNHGPFFKQSCIKFGVNPETYFTAKEIEGFTVEKKEKVCHVLECIGCGTKNYYTRKSKTVTNYKQCHCSICKSKLKYYTEKRFL